MERFLTIHLVAAFSAATVFFCVIVIEWTGWVWLKDVVFGVIGVVAGYQLSVRYAEKQLEKEATANKTRVKEALIATLVLNETLVKKALDVFDKGLAPNFPLDGAKLSSVVLGAQGVLDSDFLREVDWHRFQIEHASSKMLTLSQLTTHTIASGVGVSAQTMGARLAIESFLKAEVKKHLEDILKGGETLIERAEAVVV